MSGGGKKEKVKKEPAAKKEQPKKAEPVKTAAEREKEEGGAVVRVAGQGGGVGDARTPRWGALDSRSQLTFSEMLTLLLRRVAPAARSRFR